MYWNEFYDLHEFRHQEIVGNRIALKSWLKERVGLFSGFLNRRRMRTDAGKRFKGYYVCARLRLILTKAVRHQQNKASDNLYLTSQPNDAIVITN
ncbi:MAG: hypothetical protein DSY90_12065 [Deltaproteobacteria bacterium]|nr:MAG: hypothetical protein DSY90_12065 [Deltaproteobacteria bacterium]